ncbi:MAG: SoxR reducing system RseC family protein [Methylosarcina sp.]
MIKETVIVTRSDSGRIWFRSQQTAACGACAQQNTCGTATLAQMLPKREFALDCALNVQVGDPLSITIDDSHIVLGSALLYLAPLMVMLAGVGLAMAFLPSGIAESWLPEIALTTLLLAFWLIHRIQPLIVLHLSLKPKILKGSKH